MTTTTATKTQQQQQKKNNNNKLWNDEEPATVASEDSCHECSTIIDTNDAFNDELLQTTFRWMFWSPHHLVKDDVFFAPSSITSSATSSIIDVHPNNNGNWVPTPCLSPVTSPSDFLYDREPLFDGIYQEQEEEEETDQCTASSSPIISNNSIIMHDDDWSALFSADNYDFLPLTPSSSVEVVEPQEGDEEQEHEVLLDEEDDDEDKDCSHHHHTKGYQVMNQTASTTTTSKQQQQQQQQQQQNPLKRTIEESSLLFPTTTKRAKSSKSSLPSSSFTVFENLTKMGIDWCRYCGTTEGVNWRPGPWGKRTLCNKHGCDYKGYGLASRLPRLDLSTFAKEKLEDRQRPIVQQFCVICQSPEKSKENKLIPCQGGCSRAYHQYCHSIKPTAVWYCSSLCHENKQKNKVVVDLPRKYLPLMRLQQQKKSLLKS